MTYADYAYYGETYLGAAIEEADFQHLALLASRYLDYITCHRAAKHDDLDAVKMACCALAEQYQVIETARKLAASGLSAGIDSGGAELQSQTVGSWSKTYRGGGDSASSALSALESAKAALPGIARMYLTPTGLLYRGGEH